MLSEAAILAEPVAARNRRLAFSQAAAARIPQGMLLLNTGQT